MVLEAEQEDAQDMVTVTVEVTVFCAAARLERRARTPKVVKDFILVVFGWI